MAQIEIKVLSTTALKTVFAALSPQLEHATATALAARPAPSPPREPPPAETQAGLANVNRHGPRASPRSKARRTERPNRIA